MIGTTLAHYEIRERLGRGGMGEVFRALDTRLARAASVGWGSRAWLEHDPDMDPIRDHPRFRALLDRMGTPPGS